SASPASCRHDAGSHPVPEKTDRRRIAMTSGDRGRSERDAADGILQADRQSANRDGAGREPAHRDAKADCDAAERKQQAEGCATKAEQATRQATDGDSADGHVTDRDYALRDARPHRDSVDTGANMQQWP